MPEHPKTARIRKLAEEILVAAARSGALNGSDVRTQNKWVGVDAAERSFTAAKELNQLIEDDK